MKSKHILAMAASAILVALVARCVIEATTSAHRQTSNRSDSLSEKGLATHSRSSQLRDREQGVAKQIRQILSQDYVSRKECAELDQLFLNSDLDPDKVIDSLLSLSDIKEKNLAISYTFQWYYRKHGAQDSLTKIENLPSDINRQGILSEYLPQWVESNPDKILGWFKNHIKIFDDQNQRRITESEILEEIANVDANRALAEAQNFPDDQYLVLQALSPYAGTLPELTAVAKAMKEVAPQLDDDTAVWEQTASQQTGQKLARFGVKAATDWLIDNQFDKPVLMLILENISPPENEQEAWNDWMAKQLSEVEIADVHKHWK